MDRELMYHYITTLYCIGAREEVVDLWRTYIPQLALQTPFLMHGLLALAALHLAHTKPEESPKYLQSYDKHQSIALEKYRSILCAPIEPDMADSLLALASMLSVSSMARPCVPPGAAAMHMDAIAELIIMTKGIRNVIHLAYERVRQGPLAEMLTDPPEYSETAGLVLPEPIAICFHSMKSMLVTSELVEEAREDCQIAVASLASIYMRIQRKSATADIEVGDISRWQVTLSMGYVRLIQAQSPPALIVLAFYVAAFTAVRTAWYTQDWAEKALRGISEALDSDMQHWLQWPMQQLGDKMSTLGVRPRLLSDA